MLSKLRYALASVLRSGQMNRALDDEIAYHIALQTEQNIANGMTPVEARRQAVLAFGGVQSLREAHRDGRGTRWLSDLWADVRHSFRTLARTPALTAAAILTLALAIGADTAIYSAVNAVLVRPLPFRRPERLVLIGENNKDFLWHMSDAAPANYLDWRARVAGIQDMMAYVHFGLTATLMVDGTPRLVPVARVTGNFFSVLGVVPERGEGFTDADTWDSGTPRIVVSDRLWTALGRDPAIVGRTIPVDGRAALVVGIAPRGFAFPQPNIDLWSPVGWSKDDAAQVFFRRAHWLRVIARLKPGVSVEQANAQLRAVAEQLKVEYPATNRIMEAELQPLHRFLAGDTRLPLLVLLGAVSLLLLIACANIASLSLIRAASRSRETAIRAALGAGRSRLVRQAFAESLVLSAAGGAAGLGLGWVGTRILTLLLPPDGSLLPVDTVALDWRVALYVVGVSLACGMLFGIAPAVWASRRAPGDALATSSRGASAGVHVRRWGARLAVAEVAVALALSVAAGLLVRSYAKLQGVDPGFDPTSVLTASIELPGNRYGDGAPIRQFFDQLLERVRGFPGVTDAAAVTRLPLTRPGWSSAFSIAGASGGNFGASLLHRQVTPDYFRTMRVPLRAGRWITTADAGPPYVVVINDVFAREYFKGADPVGQRICFDQKPDSNSTWRTIVGVVGSEHQVTPGMAPEIEAIAPFAQEGSHAMSVVARTRGDPMALAPLVRSAVRDLDPQLAITRLETMSDIRATSMARDRFVMTLVSMFGLLGVVLAVVGVYGVLAELVRERMREMGIRLALGAQSRAVQWLIVQRGLLFGAAGVGLGLVLALAGTRGLARLLFQVPPSDPLTFAVVAAALLAATLAASWLPAWRSSHVDPVAILREE
ncbi:MAG TPA: ABC transporter permease [Gemmatimonadales bacterium]|nr:ABC transporter permease [Gemmatimonadales bacterium]